MRYRVAALILVPVLGASAVGYAASRIQPSARPVPFGTLPAANGMHTPATSCAAASCHNSGQVGREGGEFTTWSDGDPHRKAYAVLFNDVSVTMMKNLAGGDPVRWKEPAHKEALCLKCHAVNEDRYFHGEVLDDRQLGEGVGCDGCHGPSKDWLAAHYQPFWKGLSDREKYDQYKFVPTKDLTARSLVCAGCHVGQRDREVNHDLIAAGHPRLAFEYARYHFSDRYPKHWVEKQPNPQFELKAWLVGQVSSLRAACDLLAKRAEEATAKKAPWPELSEMSCYACHQTLNGRAVSGDIRGSKGGRRERPVGLPGWQVWYHALADILPAAAGAMQADPPSFAKVMELRKVVEKTNPDAAATAVAAKAAVAELDAWLARTQAAGYGQPSAPGASRAVIALAAASAWDAKAGAAKDYDWDFLAQHALAVIAAYHADGGAGGANAALKPIVERLQAALAFPTDGAAVFNSPKGYDPAAAAAAFRDLYQATR